jgi:hypothetical protein
MVSSAHEAIHQIFREDPGLFARALPKAGIALPEPTTIQLLDTDLTEIKPMARRVDTLMRVDTTDSGSYLLAVEAQGKPGSGWGAGETCRSGQLKLPATALSPQKCEFLARASTLDLRHE